MAKDDTEVNQETLKAMEFLVDAVARELRPGVIDLKLAARTLRDALDDPTPGALSLATRAFDAIDPGTRRRIQDSALSAAMVYNTKSRGPVTVDRRPSLLGSFGFGRRAGRQ